MRRLALAVISTLIAALMFSVSAVACTSDCNLPDVELTKAEGTFQDPNNPSLIPVEGRGGVNEFYTIVDKTWTWTGDITGSSLSTIELTIHTSSGVVTATEWGTLTIDDWDGLEGTIDVRTTVKGDSTFTLFDVHFEFVGGTDDFANVVGYGDAILYNDMDYGEYVIWIGFES